MRYLHVALLLLALAPLACADVARGEIDHLRDYLRNSSCRFVRNGTEFDGAQAVAHIDRKAGNAGARIHTAEDWIDYAASRSSSSATLPSAADPRECPAAGRFVRLPDGSVRQPDARASRGVQVLDLLRI